MKKSLHWALVALSALVAPGCIYVHATGDMDELWDEDEGFGDLRSDLAGCLVDPCYDLSVNGTLWRQETEWTVSFVEAGSDPAAAFRRAQEAIRHRVHHEGGQITEESSKGTDVWECSFRIDGDPGEASVELTDASGDDACHPRQLEIRWESSD